MYALFLETKACEQIDRYVAAHGGDADAIKQKCYANACDYLLQESLEGAGQEWDNWWVKHCLDGDSHKEYDVDQLMLWEGTPEGSAFWARVSNY